MRPRVFSYTGVERAEVDESNVDDEAGSDVYRPLTELRDVVWRGAGTDLDVTAAWTEESPSVATGQTAAQTAY